MTNYHISFNALHPRTLYKSSGITFVFVLEGRLQCLFNNTNIDIESGKVLLLNHRDKLIINDLDGDFMQFNMNLQFIDHVIDGLPLFEPDPSDDSMKWIKNFLAKIGIMYLRKNKYFKLLIEQQMIELLLLMVKYIPQKDMEHGMATTEDMRLNRVCQYIEHHFNEEITLHDMAEYVNLSPAYLSKLFTKKLNMGFLQYLNKVRLDHVILDLIHTDKPMIEIALQNGFSNSALLSRTFKKQMNTTPTQYREVHQIHAQPKPHTSVSKKELILNLSRYVMNDQQHLVQNPEIGKHIQMTLHPTDETIHHFKHIIQIGNMEALLSAHVQQQLVTCQSDIGLTHVLIHDPLSSPNLILNEVITDESISNYQRYNKVDACIDFLKQYRIGLIMTLSPFDDLDAYLDQLKAFLMHIVMRDDSLEHLNLKLYIKHVDLHVYQKVIHCVERFIPNVKRIVHLDLYYPQKALNILQYDTSHIEHVSFDANQNDLVNFDITDDELFENTKLHIIDKANEVKAFLNQHHIEKPLILLNWNTLTGDTHLTNGEYFRGGIIFEQFLRLNKMIDTIGYWLNYDLHTLHVKNEKEYMNSIELFHQYNSKRPAFFTSHLFKKLSSQVLFHDHNCIVVGRPEHFQIIVYDAEHFNPYLSLNSPLPFLENKDVALTVKHLYSGLYRLKHYTLDKEHGALYQVWQSYNTRTGIDAESIAYIDRLSYPKLEVSEKFVTQDLTYNLKLLTNAIHLIDVKKYMD